MRKKIILSILSVMLLTSIVPAYADISTIDTSEQKEVTIDKKTLKVDKEDKNEYEEYTVELAEKLKKGDEKEYSNIIKKFHDKNACDVINKAEKKMTLTRGESVNLDIDPSLTKTYQLDEERSVTISPLFITTETFYKEKGKDEPFVEPPKSLATTISDFFIQPSYAAATKSTGTIYARRGEYAITGTKLVSVHVQCNFYYNGSKAWYKSNFDGYYRVGTLTLFQKDQWRKWREASGKSYTATSRGVFTISFTLFGQKITMRNLVLRAKISCSKNGKITKSYTPAL